MKPIFRGRSVAVPGCRFAIGCLLLILPPAACVGSNIVGRVMNRSRNQPSAGDDVVLYNVDRTMHEMARTKSRHDGRFQFETSVNFPYLVAVLHQKVSYHTKTLHGGDPVDIAVYDSVQKLGGLRDESDTLFVQQNSGTTNVTEFFVISNQSNPPRTLAGTKTFDFQLPQGAVLNSTAIQPPGTLPLRVSATYCGQRNQYCLAYPIRPGTTRLRVVYHMKQPATSWITLLHRNVAQSVTLMIPESLQLETKTAGILNRRGAQSGLAMYVATRALTDGSLAFRFSSGDEHTGTWASLVSPGLQSGLAQVSAIQSVQGRTQSQPGDVLTKKVLVTFLTGLALMAMIAVGGSVCAHRFRGRGEQS
jgi:hypothetical protein